MRIAILVEGKTETAFKESLNKFLETRLSDSKPKLDFRNSKGRIPKQHQLKRDVERLLRVGPRAADAVIALTDVYTGQHTGQPDFRDAADAKRKMKEWVGDGLAFYPHAAQYEFEAWLLPYWEEIRKLSGTTRNAPPGQPENVNHNKPPSHWIREVFSGNQRGRHYVKPRDGARILRNQDLAVAANQCPELKAFLDTILTLCEGDPLP